jgi:hypothetical protein
MNGDYLEAMKGGYEGCSAACGDGACGCGCHCGIYTYANVLAMTNYRNGGTVTSIDSVTFGQRINFCNEEFNGNWHGGLETGIGWCFGCNCNAALELVYWGIYPDTMTRTEFGNLDSLIDFSSLDYPVGTNAQLAFDGAAIHQVQYDFEFHSVELNLVGTGLNGGPFGCGQFGCRPCGSGRFGAGWMAGFRYLRLTDSFLFSSDTTDGDFDGDPTEIHYAMQYKNDLFGFQVGGGLSWYVTNHFTAYTTAKFGIYNNHVTGLQQVYGPQGFAVINNSAFTGTDFNISSEDDALAGAGQWDLGGSWAITDHCTINAGYRVMALTGVATADTNLKTANFHDVDGIASPDCFGSFILHGAYVGAGIRW